MGKAMLSALMLSVIWMTGAQAAEKAEVFVQSGHPKEVLSVAISPDGKFALAGSKENILKLWDIRTGREIRTFKGHNGAVMSVAFSPDGKYALSGSFDSTMRLWDINTGSEIRSITVQQRMGSVKMPSPLKSVAFSPDGKYALSGGSATLGDSLKLWDVSSGSEIRTFEGGPSSISSVAFSPDGKYVLAAGLYVVEGKGKQAIKLWEAETGRELRKIVSDFISSVVFSPDGKYFLSAEQRKLLKLRDVQTGDEIRTFGGMFSGHSAQVSSVAFTPDGKYALSGSWDKSLILWDINTGEQIRTISTKVSLGAQSVYSVAVTPDGKYALCGGSGDSLQLWDITTGSQIKTVKAVGTAPAVKIVASPDGKHALLQYLGSVKLWDIGTGTEVRTMRGHTSAAISPDGKYVLSQKSDNSLVLSDVVTGSEIRSFKGHSGLVVSIAFSPDGKYALSGSPEIPEGYVDNTIRLWDIDKGEEIRTFGSFFNRKMGTLQGVAFSPDGRHAMSAHVDKLVLWDVNTGEEVRTVKGPLIVITAVAFSPKGEYVLSSGSAVAKTLTLWDMGTGSELKTLKGHTRMVDSVAVSPDGKHALSGSSDNSLKLWNMETGEEIGTLKGNTGKITSVAFAPDGKHAFSGSDDGVTIFWNLTTGNELARVISFYDGEWITITPEGYYNSSQNGHKYLNVRLGNSNTVYGIDQFYDVFYRPDIVHAKLQGEDISSMVGITIDDAIKSPPPTVKFTTIPANSGDATAKACYQVKNSGGGIGEVRLFQNGKLIKSDGFYRETVATATPEKRKLVAMNSRAIQDELRGLAIKEKEKPVFMEAKPKGEAFEECVEIEAVPGDNEISVTAFNAQNTVQSYLQTASFTATRPPEEPHLYILAVGIDKYRDPSANLKYAAKDAKDFLAKLPAKAATIYKPENIHVISLTDTQAGKAGILGAIEQLSKRVKQGDGFILFNASHGVLLQNQYYIVTADFDGDISTTSNLISSNEIVDMSKKIKSLSQLFIFDTCHAGGIDNIVSGLYDARMSVMAKKMGLHIYASAGSVQSAMDGYEGNGLYTHTLLEGMENGKDVDRDKTGKVTVKDLGLYSMEKTTEISTKLGHPQTPFIINFGRDNPLFAVQ